MPSADVLDFAKLLAPIPGDAATGQDLRGQAGASSIYYKVKDARNAARAIERQIEAGTEDPPIPDWKTVIQHASKALEESTKDLEICAYLMEGLLRTNSFAGLRDGFKLARSLVEQYWDGLFPSPDEEGIATKVAPITGLNGDDAEGTLFAPINRVVIVDSATYGRLTYSNYLQALATSKIADVKAREKKIADGAMSFEKFQSAVDEVSPLFFRVLHDDLVSGLDEFAQMNAAFDAKCGMLAPPASAIRSSLTNVLDAIKDVARVKLAQTQPKPVAAAQESVESGTDDGESDVKQAENQAGEKLPSIRNREDALDAIVQLAEYFRRIEPHSLVPHALEQAVRWGRMPLTELLLELIPDDDSRNSLFKQVGIRGTDSK